MQGFAAIEERALARHGQARLNDVLARRCRVLSSEDIAAQPNDRWLAEATRMIFQAGFNWDVIDKKWPNFESAFNGFGLYFEWCNDKIGWNFGEL